MKLLKGVYTQRFNRHHRCFGHLLQGRYKSILVEKESHLLELARYVVLNPVRARIVRSVRDWAWSSYRATSGQAEVPEFLEIDWILSQFDAMRDRAIQAYRHFARKGRCADVWNDLRAGSLLGGPDFVDKMRPKLLQTPLDQNVLRRERDAARPSLREIFPCCVRQTRSGHAYPRCSSRTSLQTPRGRRSSGPSLLDDQCHCEA